MAEVQHTWILDENSTNQLFSSVKQTVGHFPGYEITSFSTDQGLAKLLLKTSSGSVGANLYRVGDQVTIDFDPSLATEDQRRLKRELMKTIDSSLWTVKPVAWRGHQQEQLELVNLALAESTLFAVTINRLSHMTVYHFLGLIMGVLLAVMRPWLRRNNKRRYERSFGIWVLIMLLIGMIWALRGSIQLVAMPLAVLPIGLGWLIGGIPKTKHTRNDI